MNASAINTAIKGTGLNPKINAGDIAKRKEPDSDDSSSSPRADTRQGAESRVSQERTDAKSIVKKGTLVSTADKSPNTNSPRGGPENYAAHNPLGFNGYPHSNNLGLAGFPPGAALGLFNPALNSAFGNIPSPPRIPSQTASGQTSTSSPQKPETEPSSKKPSQADPQKTSSSQKPVVSEENRAAHNFLKAYKKATDTNNDGIPNNFQSNHYAASKDRTLQEKINAVNEAIKGYDDKSLSAVKTAYDDLNKYLKDNKALQAEDLLNDPNAIADALEAKEADDDLNTASLLEIGFGDLV